MFATICIQPFVQHTIINSLCMKKRRFNSIVSVRLFYFLVFITLLVVVVLNDCANEIFLVVSLSLLISRIFKSKWKWKSCERLFNFVVCRWLDNFKDCRNFLDNFEIAILNITNKSSIDEKFQVFHTHEILYKHNEKSTQIWKNIYSEMKTVWNIDEVACVREKTHSSQSIDTL